jgi:hypothetical protein
MNNRYSAVPLNALEMKAISWLDGFYQLEHLLCTRAWVTALSPAAPQALRFAAFRGYRAGMARGRLAGS